MANKETDAQAVIEKNGETQVVVRHRWDQGFILIVALGFLCIGIVCGVMISHHSRLARLEDRVDLADTWVRTHRHEAPGAQAQLPVEPVPETKGDD